MAEYWEKRYADKGITFIYIGDGMTVGNVLFLFIFSFIPPFNIMSLVLTYMYRASGDGKMK